MRVAVIINPVAGVSGTTELARRHAALATDVLAAEHVHSEVFITERAGHARDLAREAVQRGTSVVTAWGGDGTVNEVAAALAGGPAALGIVQGGSGNGLARMLNVPASPERALRHLLHAPQRVIDTGEIDGRFFVNVAGVGFDAHIAARFAALGRSRRGFLRYASIVVSDLGRYVGGSYALELDGASAATHRAFLLSFANGRQWGNGAIIAPGAELDDGALDVVIVEERGRAAVLRAIPPLFRGTVDRLRGVNISRVQSATVTADRPLTYHADGESFIGPPSIAVRVLPRTLRICA